MDDYIIDNYLCKHWNAVNSIQKVAEENFWEFCRLLEKHDFLESDKCSITTLSIGPFKIASSIQIEKRDMLIYFIEIVVPAIFSYAAQISFESVYTLYLIPAGKLLINLAAKNFWIKDLLQWEILLFIKQENKNFIFPTKEDIKNDDKFIKFEKYQIDNAIYKLKNYDNFLGESCALIKEHHDGKFESVV